MKHFILSVFILVACVLVHAQDSVFYYDEFGGKIHLTKENGVKIIQFTNETATRSSRLLNEMRQQNVKMDTLSPFVYKVSGDFRQKAISDLLLPEQKDSNILYISDMLLSKGSILWETDEIVVKFFPNANLSEVLETNRIPYKEYRRLGSNPQTYLVTV